jgi:hypothetical protein
LKNNRPWGFEVPVTLTICSLLHCWMILGVHFLLKKI